MDVEHRPIESGPECVRHGSTDLVHREHDDGTARRRAETPHRVRLLEVVAQVVDEPHMRSIALIGTERIG